MKSRAFDRVVKMGNINYATFSVQLNYAARRVCCAANYAIFSGVISHCFTRFAHELCDQMRFQADYAKLHH